MRSVSALVLFVFTAAMPAVAQPRSEQVDPSALAAAAARLGRVIWSPMATLDRIGVDPFVLRPPVAAECPDRTVYCPPVYRSDFVLGGVAGADVWMNLSERLLVQSRGRAVVDWYREFSDVSSVAPDVSQAVRYVGPRVHLDFGWRHVQSRRGMLAELAQRIRRTAFYRRLTAAVRVGRFALEAELGGQRVRHDDPPVAHRLFRYDWFDADITRTRALLRPAVAGPSRWSFTVERLEHRSFSRPVRERRLDATTVMLETELLTGLRLEGRVGVGWTRQRRPDYHEQLGAASSSLSAPLWRIDLSLPSEAGDLAFELTRRFTQSVLRDRRRSTRCAWRFVAGAISRVVCVPMPSCSPLVFSTSTGSIRVRPSVRGSMSVASRSVSVSRHIAYTSHASLRARCASSASPSASRIGRCSHPFCIVQGGCFHSLDAITPSMSTPTRNGSMTDT